MGVTLSHARYSPVGDHMSYKATLHTLQQMPYWPPMSHDTQTNWVEPAPKLVGGNKFLLTVTCSFIKSVPNDTVIPAAALLLNQRKFYIGLSSPRTELVSMSGKGETSP
ncbi:hypothetical protein CRENBAI_009050 [Crenichthys baileyi]|uniref:Uncharacterized protein n=1 Tax=Crenichthys baileyi TaxID=28760 RepID=A0AAV9QVG9_9TELE